MNTSELREKSEEELLRMLEASRKELKALRFSVASKTLEDTSQIKKKKVSIAKILTVLGELRVLHEMKKSNGANKEDMNA